MTLTAIHPAMVLQIGIAGGCRGVGSSSAGAPAGRLAWAACSSPVHPAASAEEQQCAVLHKWGRLSAGGG